MKSTDGGTTWTSLPNPPNLGGSGWYGLPLAVAPSDANTVFLSGGGGPILESIDGGLTWFSLEVGVDGKGPHVDHHAFAFDASGKLLDGNDGGIWRLENAVRGSIRWSDLNTNLQLTQYIGIALDPTNADIAYGGSQDNGTSKFNDSQAWRLIQAGDGGFVRVDPNNPSTVYHELVGISLERSDNGGLNWTQKTSGISSSDPRDFYVPFILDRANPQRLLLGTNRVYETTNRGDRWNPISTPGANGWTVTSNINALATAASDSSTIYASAGSHLFVSFDDGITWRQSDIPGVTGPLRDIEVDPSDNLTAYAVSEHFGDGHVFQTTDGGLTWSDISGNLPDLPTYSLAIDPRTSTLYVGNDDGVYLSADQGGSWARFGVGLPHAEVRDIELNTDLQILAAGTHGRGLWEILVPPPDGVPADLRGLGLRRIVVQSFFEALSSGTVDADALAFLTLPVNESARPQPRLEVLQDLLGSTIADEVIARARASTTDVGGPISRILVRELEHHLGAKPTLTGTPTWENGNDSGTVESDLAW
jgi:photosystem II stability/assembly factor-like uncharacterized protein